VKMDSKVSPSCHGLDAVNSDRLDGIIISRRETRHGGGGLWS